MTPISPLPAITALLVALAVSWLIAKHWGAPPAHGRFAAIDGLRGYLAFFVFLHHACLWYFYLHTGQFTVSESHLYAHFGPSSVALFFMITGFLFFSKLIEGKRTPLDWGKLYISRFLRLAPLYYLLMALLFVVVIDLSHGVRHESIRRIAMEIADWLGFTVFGMVDINGVDQTLMIVAGVTWSLVFEWFFYFSLPLLALAVGVRPPLRFVVCSLAIFAGLAIWHPHNDHLIWILRSFLGGIAAAFLVRFPRFKQFAGGRMATWVVTACLVATVGVFPSPDGFVQFLLLSVAFALIAAGNGLFGVLVNPVSRTMGEMAYSIYLLHGILLYVALNFVVGLPAAKAMSPLGHWLVVIGLTPLLISICYLTFRFVERPAMQSTTRCTGWLRSNLPFRSKAYAVTGVTGGKS